jgi:gliding motility-associated-like protein
MPGAYTVEVFHDGVSVYKKTHLVEAPDNFEISVEKTNNSCYGASEGSISITATGGTPPYLYSIDNGANYSGTPTFNGLPKATYSIRVKDSNDCIVSQTILISQSPYFSVYHPAALEVDTCLTQEDIDAAFTTWLTGFNYSGGTAPITESITHDLIPSPCGGSITVTYTAVDQCGVEKSCESTFTVPQKNDLEIATQAQPMLVSCEANPETAFQQWLTSHGNASATSTCDVQWTNNYSEDLWDNSCENSRNITVTFTVSNGCESVETTATFSIEDTTAPVLSSAPENITVSCNNIPEAAVITALDNCDDTVDVRFEETSTTDGCSSTIERIWTATDCAGNSTTHSQTITLEDKQAPSFVETLPTDLTVACGQEAPQAVVLTAVDNCDDDAHVTFEEKTTTDGCSSTLERTWTATDCAGNLTTHTQYIKQIQDQQPPSLIASSEGYQQNINVSCGEIPAAPALEFEDDCSDDIHIVYSENSSAISQNGSFQITRLWKVSDPCNNTAEFTQVVNITPNNELKFNELPIDLVVECGDSIPDPAILTASNGCETDIPVTFTETQSDTECTLTITRHWTAMDGNANNILHEQIIIVKDTQAPSFVEVLPEDQTLNCTSIPKATVLTAVDECDENAVVAFEESIATEGCTQVITRLWTASDCAGNFVIHTQTIKLVHDNEAPTLAAASLETFQEEITITCANIPDAPELEFEDQCSTELKINFEETSTYVNNQTDYEIQRIWQVTDPCKNQATFRQIVKVSQHNIEQDLVQIMLCQRDAVYDLSTLLPTSSNSGGQWTLSTEDNYLNGSFFDPTTADLGVYTAHYTLDDACIPQTIVTITVHDDCVVLPCDSSQSISISKAITPNGDPYNEYFIVSGLADCGFKLELQVFNRWGAKIYESMDYQNNWNAFSNRGNSQYMPAGTYYYILTVVDSGYDPIKGYVYVGTTSK